MSSEAALEAAPMVGNAHLGQRGSGHSAVSWLNMYPGSGEMIKAPYESAGTMGPEDKGADKPMRMRGVCAAGA